MWEAIVAWPDLVVAYWAVLVFIVGASVGSFLNVVVARLPLDKSVVWPDSRCGHCQQSIRWYDNVPLLSYLWLRGRCRTCGARFSAGYLIVELAAGLGFVGLYFAELVYNVHGWPMPPAARIGWFPLAAWLGFAYHALLFSLLLAASVCDLKQREIPLLLTLFGTFVGLAGSALMPWPFPHEASAALNPAPTVHTTDDFARPLQAPVQGIYAWPVWWPLPAPLAPGGNWLSGLLTGVAGAVAGTMLLRTIGFLFSWGLGKEALGLGDADLMMMAGAFLGWQIVMVGFFLSVFPALFFGLVLLVVSKDNSLPYGPSLSVGVLGTSLGWRWIVPHVQPLLLDGVMMALMLAMGAFFLVAASVLLRVLRREPS